MQSPKSKTRQALIARLSPAAVIPSVVFMIVLAGCLMGSWKSVDNLIYDRLVGTVAPAKSTLPITIVGIDEPSFAALGVQWPWPRSMHAKLIDKLRESGAAVIAFDVVLSEASSPKEDDALANAIESVGSIVLAADAAYQETPYGRHWIRMDPLPLLKQAGAIGGLATISLDTDLVVRRMPEGRDIFWREILELLNKRQPGVVVPPPNQENRLIGYIGAERTFPYVSYYKVLEGNAQLTADAFKDQIVIVGRDVRASTDIGAAQADLFATPFVRQSGNLMPGAEVHANILESAILGRTIEPLGIVWVLEFAFASIVLAGLGMRRWTPLNGFVVSACILLVISATVVGLFVWSKLWMPPTAAMIAVVFVFIGKGAYGFVVERQRQLETRRAFSLYLSPDVVDQLMAQPERLKLGGERRETTFLFTDLAGFTDLSERLSAEQVTVLLNMHFTRMGGIIKQQRGTLNRFIGDAIMAFWGAPLDDPLQCDHAVATARAMCIDMHDLRRELREKGLPEIYLRIGINSGVAVIGNLGSEDRFDYTAIGDCVNLAARLEGVNKLYSTEVLISKETVSRLTDRSGLRFVDRIIVKGKTEPIDVYTVESDQQIIDWSRAGFDAYVQQRWPEAVAVWRKILEVRPDDGVVEVQLRRVAKLEAEPPGIAWNAATSLDKM